MDMDLYSGFAEVQLTYSAQRSRQSSAWSNFSSRPVEFENSDRNRTSLSTGTWKGNVSSRLMTYGVKSPSSTGRGDGTASSLLSTDLFAPPPAPIFGEEITRKELQNLQTKIGYLGTERNKLILSGQYDEGLDKSKEIVKLSIQCLKLPCLTQDLIRMTARPLVFSATLRHADAHVLAGKHKQAERLYASLLRQDKTDEPDLSNRSVVVSRLAELYQQQGNFESALQMWLGLFDESTIMASPERSKIVSRVASCYGALGRFDLAYKYNEINAETGSDHQAAFSRLIYLAKRGEEMGKLREAFQWLVSVSQCVHCGVQGTKKETPATTCHKNTTTSVQHDFDSRLARSLNNKILNPKSGWSYRRDICRSYIRDAAKILVDMANDQSDSLQWCAIDLTETSWQDIIVDLDLRQCAMLFEKGLPDQAVELLVEGDYDEMDEKSRSRIYSFLCWIFYQQNNVTRCLDYAVKAYAINSQSSDARMNLACGKFAAAEYDEALELFDSLTLNDSTDYRSATCKGLTLRKLRHYEEALQALLAIPETFWTPQIKLEISELQTITGRPQDAYDILTSLRDSQPDAEDVDVLLRLGALAEALQDRDTSSWYYHQVLQSEPANLLALDALGRYAVAKNMPEIAVDYYCLASQIEPADPKWKVRQAAAMRRAGHIVNAYDLCLTLHDQYPDDVSCLQLLVNISKQLRIPEKQTALFRMKLQTLAAQCCPTPVLERQMTGFSRQESTSRFQACNQELPTVDLAKPTSRPSIRLPFHKASLTVPASPAQKLGCGVLADNLEISRMSNVSTNSRKPILCLDEDVDLETDHLLPRMTHTS